ncbi:tetratricopeptide repeat-containing sensor histidine kinase [Zobellia uliginosa]|uniref:tetratricopeptide repeat-containing sensor histidine kinase n=1 Tax=Zobellia uliginosa TaxID=143224 RepID=UPI0026E22CEE|nr:tetratricopeptide repeat protein [Zobellia uliginosa]MDO6516609.1 tetratricopeptide repeat protein [Zobellia uliginosa]
MLLLVQLCWAQEPTEALTWFKKGLTLIDKEQNYHGGIKALDSAAALHPEKALLIQIKYAKGVALNSQGNLSEAVAVLEENIPLIETCDDKTKIKFHANNYRVLGDVYKGKGKSLLAMKNYQKALSFSEKYSARSKATVLHQIGVLLMEKRNYLEAEKYFHQTTDQYLNEHLQLGKYINLGEVYLETDRNTKAKQQYDKAEKLALKSKNNMALCHIYIGYANIFFEANNYKKAIEYYEKTIELSEEIGAQFLTTSSLLYLAIAYNKTKQAFKALPYLDQAAIFLNKEPSINYQLNLYDTYASVYENMGNYEKSIIYLKKVNAVKDSMFNIEKNRQFEELKIAYETKEKQQEIEFLKLQKKKNELEISQKEKALKALNLEKELEASQHQNTILQLQKDRSENENKIILLKKSRELAEAEASKSQQLKNAYLIGFIVFSIPLGILLIVYYQKLKTQKTLAKKQEELNAKQILTLKKEQELKSIRASIEGQEKERKRIAQELHDAVGGSLAGIKLQLDHLSSKEPKLLSIVHHLDETYNQVRHISHDLLLEKIENDEFVQVIKNYLKKIATSTHINIDISFFNETLINEVSNVIQTNLYKIVQELINNTIKHAEASSIEIQLNAHADMINLLFEDNGRGFVYDQNKNGIGLRNINERVNSLGGTTTIDSQHNHGMLVNIIIPIKKLLHDT